MFRLDEKGSGLTNRVVRPYQTAPLRADIMSAQLRALGALRRGALGLRRALPRGQNPMCLGSVQAAFPTLGASLSLENRHFSTSDAVPPTLELTMADGQLTGASYCGKRCRLD